MKIQFGTSFSPNHAGIAGIWSSILLIVIMVNMHFHNCFGDVEKLILQSRGINVTKPIPSLYCDIPYNDCLCSVLSNTSNITDDCISHARLTTSRILPLISFCLQVYLVNTLFSLSRGTTRHIIIYTLWIASIFIFFGIIRCIYLSSCYHVYVSWILFSTGVLLFWLSIHNMFATVDNQPPPPSYEEVVDVVIAKPEKDYKGNLSEEELI